jgi:hypothetical protein
LVKILKTPDNSFQVQKRISGAGFFIMQGFSVTGKGMKMLIYELYGISEIKLLFHFLN